METINREPSLLTEEIKGEEKEENVELEKQEEIEDTVEADQEEAKSTDSPLELSIDEIIQSEDDVPNMPEVIRRQASSTTTEKEGETIGVHFDCGDVFDSKSIHLLLKTDYEYYKRYKHYYPSCFCSYSQEPFSYPYERKWWTIRLFSKLHLILRRFLKPLKSSPFTASGECPFFEFEVLYSPRNCDAYVLRSHQMVRRNFERFKRAAVAFNLDSYESASFSEIIEDTSTIKVPASLLKSKGSGNPELDGNKDRMSSEDFSRRRSE